MKLSDFILLNEEEKKQAVLHSGVLISKRSESAAVIFLFHVQNFYVEACFNPFSKDIEEFRMFEHTCMLQPYLDSICLNDLLN